MSGNIGKLPYDLIYEYMLTIDNPLDMESVCSLSRAYAYICSQELFWKEKVKHDYGSHTEKFPYDEDTWKDTWIGLKSAITININNRIIDKIITTNINDEDDIITEEVTPNDMEYTDGDIEYIYNYIKLKLDDGILTNMQYIILDHKFTVSDHSVKFKLYPDKYRIHTDNMITYMRTLIIRELNDEPLVLFEDVVEDDDMGEMTMTKTIVEFY